MNSKFIIWASCAMALALSAITCNIMQILKILKLKKKKSPFYMAVLSLSAADILSSAMFLVQGLRKILTTNGMVADNVLFRFAFIGCYFSVFSSCVHIIFIAAQRLIVICYPLHWKSILKLGRVKIVVCIIWISSSVFASLSAIPSSFKQKLSILIFVSCAMIVVAYSLIPYFSAQNHGSAAAGVTGPANGEGRKKSIQVHSVAIMVTFLVCTFPYGVARFYSHSSMIYIVCDIMFAINPLVDTALYFFLSKQRQSPMEPSAYQLNSKAPPLFPHEGLPCHTLALHRASVNIPMRITQMGKRSSCDE